MRRAWLPFLVLAALGSAAVGAEETDDVTGLIAAGMSAIGESPLSDMAAAIGDIRVPQNMQEACKDIEDALSGRSIDDLAAALPLIENVMGFLSSTPEGKPYADWLRQRLDYFDMANDVLQHAPVKRPPVVPRFVPRPKPVPGRPAQSPGLATAREEERQMEGLARNQDRWRKKLASRPVPSGAEMMIPALKEAFISEGVPPEWVWLAEVESSMNPDARSPSGAVGLFQLMPATAQRFGLRTGFRDERRSPQKSARAAAQYLHFLHDQFGSWPLAIAAYNAGEGCISRTLKANRARTFDQIAADLPLETQMYVPKVMAMVALRERVDPRNLPPPMESARRRG